MAASLPLYQTGNKILVTNIPSVATCDKLQIHFQRNKNGGCGDVLSVTFPRRSSKPDQAVVEFEDQKTVRSVLLHTPHRLFDQDLIVTEFPPQTLGFGSVKISQSALDKLPRGARLDEKFTAVENQTGVAIKDNHIEGQFYQLLAASDVLEDMLVDSQVQEQEAQSDGKQNLQSEERNKAQASPQKRSQSTSSDHGVVPPLFLGRESEEKTVEVKRKEKPGNVSFDVDKEYYALMKLIHISKLKTMWKKYKVTTKEVGISVIFEAIPDSAGSNPTAAAEAFGKLCSKFFHTVRLSNVDKTTIFTASQDDIRQAIEIFAKQNKKVHIFEQKNKRVVFLSCSQEDGDAGEKQFKEIMIGVLTNKELFSFKFDKSNLAISVFHGNITHERVDVVVSKLNPESDNEVLTAGGSDLKTEVQQVLDRKSERANGDILRTSGGNGDLQCRSVIHYLHDPKATNQFDLSIVLLEILNFANNELKAKVITLPIGCIGFKMADKLVAETILLSISNFIKASNSVTHLREIRVLHSDETQAKSIAKMCSTLKTNWVSSMASTSAEKSKSQDAKEEEEDVCAICLETLSHDQVPLKDLPCKHVFHQSCIDRALNFSKKCPTCMAFCGKQEGNQPPGNMTSRQIGLTIPGYAGCGAIQIDYSFSGGIQGPEHPHPGKPYYGTSRRAYLPSNTEGREVLLLLRKAFDMRMTFTVGRSVTTGMDDSITWNDIHHKTSIRGGSSGFGYPDPTYLQRVKSELAAKGVTIP